MRMPAPTHARRTLLIAFVAACAIWYWKQNVLDVDPTPGLSDFRFYYYAAQHILHGESPFLTADYIYPPLLACLLVPIAAFDYFTARWIWFVFSHACLLGAGVLVVAAPGTQLDCNRRDRIRLGRGLGSAR